MFHTYVDFSRVNPPLEVQHVLRERLNAGISCGTVVLREGSTPGRTALAWKFNGCPTVELEFPDNKLDHPEGAEKVAEMFLDVWRKTFATAPPACAFGSNLRFDLVHRQDEAREADCAGQPGPSS